MSLPGRFGPGDSGLHMGAMLQCVRLTNRGSPYSELNVDRYGYEERLDSTQKALHRSHGPHLIFASSVAARKGCAVGYA